MEFNVAAMWAGVAEVGCGLTPGDDVVEKRTM